MQKSIFKNTLLKMLLSIFNILIPLLIGPYIARLFDKELYGRYNDALTIISILIPIAGFGIYNYGIRTISRIRENKEKTSRLFTILFTIGILTNLAGFALFILYFTQVRENADFAIYAALSIQIFANIFLTEWMNEAYENYSFIMVKTIVVRFGYVLSIFLFVKNPDDVALYALLLSLSNLINNLISFLYLKTKIKFCFSLHLSEFSPIVKSLFCLVLITNSGLLFTQLDRLFLSRFGGPVINVSYYVLSQSLFDTLLNVINPIILVSIARLSKLLSEGNHSDYLRLQEKSSRTYLLISYPMSIGAAMMGSFIMQLYGGYQYADAGIVLTAFALRNLIRCLDMILANQVLYLYGQERLIMHMMLLSGLMNVFLNSLLVLSDAVTPANLVATTAAAELILVLLEHQAAKSLNPQFHLFPPGSGIYFLFSLLFFPIRWCVTKWNLGFLADGFTTVAICICFYFIMLYLVKDPIVHEYLYMIRKKILPDHR